MVSAWQWIAYGKHPAARDYIRLGSQFPLGGNLYSWVEQGYARGCRGGFSQRKTLWRFWIRGTAQEQLACGVLRQSNDAIGRPYPLLLMGGGIFPCWHENWEHLPLACEGIWNAAEVLSTADVKTVSELVQGLSNLTMPADIPPDDTLPPLLPFTQLSGDFGSEFGLFSLKAPNGSFVAMAAAMRLCLLLKNRIASPPVAILIGGGETACMAIMRRPLKPLDFEALWDLSE